MCDICFCILLARKITNMHHRTSSHRRPIDRVDTSRCAISVFVFSWPENHNKTHIAHRPIPNGWSMCDVFCCSYWPEKSQDACRTPCGKQHFRGIATPDWVGTLRRCEHTREYVRFVKLPLPNEDFGRLNQPFRMCFRSTFQRFVAQIEYSRP